MSHTRWRWAAILATFTGACTSSTSAPARFRSTTRTHRAAARSRAALRNRAADRRTENRRPANRIGDRPEPIRGRIPEARGGDNRDDQKLRRKKIWMKFLRTRRRMRISSPGYDLLNLPYLIKEFKDLDQFIQNDNQSNSQVNATFIPVMLSHYLSC